MPAIGSLLKAVGQRTDRLGTHRLDLEQVDNLFDELSMLDFLTAGRAGKHHRLPEAMPHVDVTPEHQVLEHRHVLEQLDVLKRASHTPAGSRTGGGLGELALVLAVVENDAPSLGAVQAADAVQQRCLA